ncbi:ATP-binding protein [Romboutsia lituseburensis]|uniref:PAS domain-containing sensor histidine kinase n=1 Tax=Romboutsia lituseburensis TaxID=1537 RepID=UPI00215A4302|nr:ATP-binding protein [Romboutsia lituseburensis]MCR8744780.1 ATP-binding protein [Romboutsia lituseburensis]
METKVISQEDKLLKIKMFIKEYKVILFLNLVFIIIAILNKYYYCKAINLLRTTLLWIFLYTVSYDEEGVEQNTLLKILKISSLAIIVLSGVGSIYDIDYKFIPFNITLTIMNLSNLIYIINKNSKVIETTVVIYASIIVFTLILYSFIDMVYVNKIIVSINICINILTLFIYRSKQIKYKDMIKNLSYINFILNIIVLIFIFINKIEIKENLGYLVMIILFNHTYYGYNYIIKNIIKNPYFELELKNKKLNASSERLKKLNTIISKDVTIQNKIKEFILERQALLEQALDTIPSAWMITDYKFNIIYRNNKCKRLFKNDVNNFLNIECILENDSITKGLQNIEVNKNILETIVYVENKQYVLNITNNDIDFTYLISFIDITSELDMEKELRDKREEYESIVEGIPCPIMIRNVKANVKEANLQSINKAFEEFFGYNSSDINGIELVKYYDMFDINIYDNKNYRKVNLSHEEQINFIHENSNSSFIMNCTMKDKYQNEHNLEVHINNYNEGLEELKLLTFIDKSKEINIYQQINKQNQLYHKILNNIPDGIIVEALGSGEIIYANQKFKEIFGIENDSDGIWVQKYRDRLETKHLYNLQAGNKNKTIYIVNENKNIKEVKFYSKIWILDNLKHRLRIVKDLDEKREAERMKEILTKQREYDKMKMEFYANISHELKTPLNNIYSSTQLVETLHSCNKIKDQKGEINSHVKIVKQNMFRLMRLIDNIINISQVKSEIYKINKVNFDIVYLIEEIVLSINPYARSRGINLIFDTNEECLLVGLDPEAIERIVLNVLSNAIKFTPSGGEIFVSIYKLEDKVQITIKDSGVGIEEDKLIDIFEKFKQIENGNINNEFGSGIGLYLSKSLVEIQDGSIDLKSKVNKGTKVTVEFPIKEVIEDDEEIIEYGGNIEKFKIEFFDIYK